MSSTNTSMIRVACQRNWVLVPTQARQIKPRSLARSRAATATTLMCRPVRAAMAASWRRQHPDHASPDRSKAGQPNSQVTHVQTVVRDQRAALKGTTFMQRGAGRIEEAADVARGLADALLVLHNRDAHIFIAMLAKAHARRDGDFPPSRSAAGKLHAAHRPERLGNGRPGEHGGGGHGNVPARPAEAFHHGVTAALIGLAHNLRYSPAAHSEPRSRPPGSEYRAIVKIGFHPRESRHKTVISNRKAHAPAAMEKVLDMEVNSTVSSIAPAPAARRAADCRRNRVPHKQGRTG